MNRFSILAIIASVAMVSCSNTYEAKTVELADKADSVNYYLGYLTASNIKRQAFRDIDSTKHVEATAAFMDAFVKGYTTEKEELTPAAEMGKNMGGAIKNFESKGLGGVSAWGINEPLFFQGLVNAIEKDTVAFTKSSAMNFLQASFQGAPQEKVDTPKPIKGKCGKKAKDVKLASFNDSINYAYGYYFGGDVENYLLANDTTGKALDEFVEALNKTVGSKAKYPELAETAEQIARQIKEQEEVGLVGVEGLATNFEVIKQGFINGFNDFETLDAATMNAFIETTINDLKYGDKIKEGQAFLDAKAQEEGVLATGSGLLYKVIKEGKGAKPAATDKVKVHYEGKLIDGTVFDSSYQRGEPIEFGLNQVIPGWTEGVQLMSVGSTYELYIPYTLGYGERGAGAQIPPFSTLIFKVELLSIVK